MGGGGGGDISEFPLLMQYTPTILIMYPVGSTKHWICTSSIGCGKHHHVNAFVSLSYFMGPLSLETLLQIAKIYSVPLGEHQFELRSCQCSSNMERQIMDYLPLFLPPKSAAEGMPKQRASITKRYKGISPHA